MPPGRVSQAIAVVTAIAWALAWAGDATEWAAYTGGFIPARVGDPGLAGMVPVWLTPLSAALIHAGIVHLAFNMLTLVFCGRFVELAIGRWPTFGLYLLGAYTSAATQWLIEPGSTMPVVGASGAISAVLGAYALLFSRQRVKPRFGIPAPVIHAAWLGAAWIGFQLLFGYAFATQGVGIAIGAHIGGFITGLALAVPLARRHQRARFQELEAGSGRLDS